MSLLCAIEVLRQTKSLLVISGSGISQESGIPTYRGDHEMPVARGADFLHPKFGVRRIYE